MSMTQARVLVTYSTAAGSTAGIAERIAQVLRSAGCTARRWCSAVAEALTG